ncbi:MAG: glycosyltransferase family 9 protein [Sulfurospirillaceae bacterium]|nr:glycosyltransferase family 9 protein [Sulfurospirillaceae bacterium]
MKTAFLRFSALGDIAASLPVLRAFKEQPTIITTPMGKELLKDEFDHFLLLQSKSFWHITQLIAQIRHERFAQIIDLQCNDRSRLITLFSKAHIINNTHINLNQNVTAIFEAITAQSSLHGPLDTTFQPKEKTYIVLNCGSSPQWISKRLPISKWQEFTQVLYEKFGLPFILTGDQSEKAYIEEIARFIVGEKEVLAGKTTIPELKTILSNAFLTLSTDSASMHISAAQKTPTIGLFGPTNWVRSAPFGPWSTVVYDTLFYPNHEPPLVNSVKISNYFDHMRIENALIHLKDFLEK